MKTEKAKIIERIIREKNLKNCLELGFNHANSSISIASVFRDLNRGHLTTIDLKRAGHLTPNIEELLEDLNLTQWVTVYYEPHSYIQRLMKFLKEDPSLKFDFCYINGECTLGDTGSGFLLLDKVLSPGGVFILDGLDWVIDKGEKGKIEPSIKHQEEVEITQIRKTWELFVCQHPDYEDFSELDGLGIAHKKKNHSNKIIPKMDLKTIKLFDELEKLRKQLDDKKIEFEAVNREKNYLKKRFDNMESRLLSTESLLQFRTNEIRFRLGNAIVDAIRKPSLNTLLLPFTVFSLFVEGVKNNFERRKQGLESNPPFSNKTIAKTETPSLPEDQETANILSEKRGLKIETSFKKGTRDKPIVAAIMDDFTYNCFKYEADILQLTPGNFKRVLENSEIDILLVESVWKGFDESWRYIMGHMDKNVRGKITELVSLAKGRGLPTLFWNKEDPVHFDHFLPVAKLFDFIFTTDANCVKQYKNRVGHDRVFTLPFAAQPMIHNPIVKDKSSYKKKDICFAGTWYRNKYPNRKKDANIIIDPAMKYNLHIYDRMHEFKDNNNYIWPEKYQKHIIGNLDYEEMLETYKKYRVFLNINSVPDSPTMFPRRVMELLACGTNVISGHSEGIVNLLGSDVVLMPKTKNETKNYLARLITNPDYSDMLSTLGVIRVMQEHTYGHRFNDIFRLIGLPSVNNPDPGITVISILSEEDRIDAVLENYRTQYYLKKEMVVVLVGKMISQKGVEGKIKKEDNVKIIVVDESKSFKYFLQRAIDEAANDYIAIFDVECVYTPYYLSEQMSAFKYTKAVVIGKMTHPSSIGSDRWTLLNPGYENRYTDLLNSGSLTFNRETLESILHDMNLSDGFVPHFLECCSRSGIKLYSTSRFNFFLNKADQHLNDTDGIGKGKPPKSIEGMEVSIKDYDISKIGHLKRKFKGTTEYQPATNIEYFEAHLLAGRALFNMERFEEAAEAFQAVLRLSPDHPDALIMLGRANYRMKRWKNTINFIRQLIRLQPENFEAHILFGRALFNLERFKDATEVFQTTLHLSPEHTDTLMMLGRANYRMKRWENVIDPIQQLIHLQPENSEAQIILGRSLFNLERFEEAAEAFRTVLHLSPNHTNALMGLGRIYYRKRMWEESLKIWRKLISLKDVNGEVHRKTVRLLLHLDRDEEAKHMYKESSRLLASTPDGHLSLGHAAEYLSMLTEAEENFELAVQLSPESPKYLLSLGEYYLRQGILDSAIHTFKRAQELDPNSKEIKEYIIKMDEISNLIDDNLSVSSRLSIDDGKRHIPEHLIEAMMKKVLEDNDVTFEPVPGRVVVVTAQIKIGGAERQSVNTVLGLSEKNDKLESIALLSASLSGDQYGKRTYLQRLESKNVEVKEYLRSEDPFLKLSKTRLSSYVPFLKHMPDTIKNHVAFLALEFLERRPHIVHAWQDSPNINAAIAAVIVGVPKIVLSTRSLRPEVKRRRHRRYFRNIYKILLNHPGVILLNNSSFGAKDYAHWLQLDQDRIQVISNGTNFKENEDTFSDFDTDKELKKLGIPPDVPIVGTAFRFGEEKRPLLWIETAAKIMEVIPDVHFVLLGDGPMKSQVTQFVKDIGMGRNTHLVGYKLEVGPWIQLMDVLLLTSRVEGLPNVLIEAQGLGVPVVTPDIGGASETFLDGKSGRLVDPATSETLSRCLIEILGDRSWMEKAGEIGRWHVREKFNMERMINKTLSIYDLN